MKRSVKLWWLASGCMVLLFGCSCLLDYARYFASKPITVSAPYWAYVVARALEFLLPAILFGIIALVLNWRDHHKKNKTASAS